jgi:predicted Fe-Mo cluster-binding NifX family protein
LVYDTETKDFEIYLNPETGAGTEFPPDFLNRLKVEAVITFSLGPMAFEKLKKYDIKMFKADKGSIAENFEKFEKNQLKNLSPKDLF